MICLLGMAFFIDWLFAVTFMTWALGSPMPQFENIGIKFLVALNAPQGSSVVSFCQGFACHVCQHPFWQGVVPGVLCWMNAFCQGSQAPCQPNVNKALGPWPSPRHAKMHCNPGCKTAFQTLLNSFHGDWKRAGVEGGQLPLQ